MHFTSKSIVIYILIETIVIYVFYTDWSRILFFGGFFFFEGGVCHKNKVKGDGGWKKPRKENHGKMGTLRFSLIQMNFKLN